MEKVTVKQIKGIIENERIQDTVNIYVHTKVVEVLEKYQGKEPSKRIATEVQKLNPSWTVSWRNEYGMYHLEVWGGDTRLNYQSKLSLLIGYNGYGHQSDTIDLEKFNDHDCCHGSAAIERNKLRQQMLNNPDQLKAICKALNAFNKAKETIDTLLDYPMPDSSRLEKLAPTYSQYPRR